MTKGWIFVALFIGVLLVSYTLGHRYQFFRQVLLMMYVVTASVYMIWRIGWTLPHDNIMNIAAGITLLIAELGGFLLSLVFYFIFWHKYQRPEVKLNVFAGEYPSVDIFIATYNEDEAILRRSIIAAQLVAYPNPELVKVYIGDDGNRPEIAKLAEELGINYVSRPTHEHAKAGNLNHLLTVSKGALIVTMDADMIMRQNFLEKTVGYFQQPKMGFVQTPQTFYNQDPYQFNLYAENKIGNDQDFFMRRIQAQKDKFNAIMYVGSNSIFRRETLTSVGGFTTGVITEDMATGMFIQAAGWKSGFVNENLASGLAPETFADLIKQRDRWARGNIQVAKKWNPLGIKGLTFIQRLLYVDGIHYWFSGIYKMIFLMAPIMFLLFGFYSLKTDFTHILMFWLPAFLVSQLAFNLIAEKKQTVVLSNIYETATAPFMAFAVFNELFLKSKKGFAVTRKGVNSQKRYYNWGTAWPIIVLIGLSVVALIRGLGILLHVLPADIPLQGIYINVFWLAYNLVGLILAMYISGERPRLRQAERFNINQEITATFTSRVGLSGQLLDWNEYGARLELIVANNTDMAFLKQEQGTILVDNVNIPIKILWQKPTKTGVILGVEFKKLSREAYRLIIAQTYSRPSDKLVEPTYNNRIWYVIITWWLAFFKKQKSN